MKALEISETQNRRKEYEEEREKKKKKKSNCTIDFLYPFPHEKISLN